MDPSPSVEAAIKRWAERLDHSSGRLQRCAVVVDMPHRSQRQGQTFQVRVELTIPDHTIAVSRDPGIDHAHEDVYVAIADAFRAARRQLQAQTQIQRGDVKLHA